VPGLGTAGGKFQISTGWHSAWASNDYFDSTYNRSFTSLWRPHERISIMDVSARWNVNSRFSVALTLPIVSNHFSILLPPQSHPKGTRYGWDASGLGDMVAYTQTWILKPSTHPFGNIAFGLGMKIPTGNWDVRKMMPDETGTNFVRRAIYPAAIMPGDGGTGIIVGLSGYKTLRHPSWLRKFTVFGSAQYLINARNTNGTPSAVSSLGVPLNGRFASALTNSVTDSYAWQAGFAMKIPGTWNHENLKGMRLQFATGMEGIPSRDLFGGSGGFRQAGYTVTMGPGFSYQRKHDYFIVQVPIVIGEHINPGRTLLPGLPITGPGGIPSAGPFNFSRQLGLIGPLAVSVRYVRSI